MDAYYAEDNCPKMKYEKYSELALRTEGPNPARLESHQWRFLHGAMGLCTESGELLKSEDDANLIEELGDAMWYLNLCCDAIDISLDDLSDPVNMDDYPAGIPDDQSLCVVCSEILDAAKRSVFYRNDDRMTTIQDQLEEAFFLIKLIAGDNLIDMKEVLELNIKKLEKRMPEGFNEKDVVDRDLKGERQIFE